MIFLYYVHIPNTYLSNIRTFTIRGGKIIKRWIPNSCENDENLKTILRVLKFQLSLPRSSTISLLRYYLSTKPNTPTITTIFLSPPVILKIESKFKSIYIASGLRLDFWKTWIRNFVIFQNSAIHHDAHLFQKIYIVENSILFKILTFSNSYQLKQV